MAKKFYAVRVGIKPGIYTTWDEAKAQVNGVKYCEYKGFMTKEEAEAFMKEKTRKAPEEIQKINKKCEVSEKYIGADEVGKAEPLRRLYAVAAYIGEGALPIVESMGATKDSKEYTIDSDKIIRMGQGLTEFREYEDVKNEVYKTPELEVYYAVEGITNDEYNELHENGVNANAIVSILHNRACLRLNDFLLEKDIVVEDIVIDNYMGKYDYNFAKYIKDQERKVQDEKPEVKFIEKAESRFPAVALASVIGSYIEHLYHENARMKFTADGGKEDLLHFGNAKQPMMKTFEELERVYGSLEKSKIDFKHTNYLGTFLLS